MTLVCDILCCQIEVLETRSGNEEQVLQHLLHLSSQEGFLLPFKKDISEATSSQSMLSINTAVDASDQANESLWGKLTMKLKRYFSDQLSQMTPDPTTGNTSAANERRLRFVHALCSLYTTRQAWQKYCNLRSQQVAACVGLPEDSEHGFCEAVDRFLQSIPRVTAMINEDVHLFNAGVFCDVMLSMPNAIRSIYVETLADTTAAITQMLGEELEEKAAKTPQSSKKDLTERIRRGSLVGPAKKTQVDERKSSSDVTIIGQLLLDKRPSVDRGTSVLSGTYLDFIVSFVGGMSQLEQYMDGMQDVLMLDNSTAARKLKSRKNLKSECFKTAVLFQSHFIIIF